jgi:rhodanese-related sulfurtransferase
LGKSQASTAEDLLAALAEVGLKGKALGFIPLFQLQRIQQPVILHVRTPLQGAEYRHWILFRGFEGNKAKVYDPPSENGLLTIAELLSIWDGSGIIVYHSQSGTPLGLHFPLVAVAMVGFAALVLFAIPPSWPPFRKLLVNSFILATLGHALSPRGFLTNQQALQFVFAVHSSPEPSEVIDYHQLKSLMDRGACTLVDARTPQAYELFHLPGARNIPIDANYLRMRRELKELPGEKKIVVYCQSESCPWADHVASHIAKTSRKEVFVYRGGVNEWKRENQ